MIRPGATLWLGPIEKLAGSLYVELINEELLYQISEVQIRQLFCLRQMLPYLYILNHQVLVAKFVQCV
jgi:hypothetical protein